MRKSVGNFRWTVVALLFFATTINYLDRQVVGLLKPTLEKEFNWSEIDYSRIVQFFSAAYALGLLLFGRFIDYIGTKRGYSLAIIFWSLAAMAHAMATSTVGFIVARVGLGLGEAGNFPAAIKTVAEWFPKKERALATGIFNSGANIGAVIAPIVVPWLLGVYGWQMAFIATGAVGFIWLIFWHFSYQSPAQQPRLSKAEYEYILSDNEPETTAAQEPSVGWGQLLGKRQTWAFVVGKMLTDPIWWFFLFWLQDYFATTFHLDTKKPNLYLAVLYTLVSIGSIGGGYLSSALIRRGWSVWKARKTAMFIFALLVVPVIAVRYGPGIWGAVALIGLAGAAHQAWSANIFTTASDMFPKRAVSTVVGIGSMAGSVGGIIFPEIVGRILQSYKQAGDVQSGYGIIFLMCGSAYLLAWLVMHVLTPTMKPVQLDSIR
ncbi:ACS family hexuronate transporter-like MFS transporter [Spirosoma oryzae]|uniref:ACS family hexuronate transporter-like MFS transporter n=1 Tax=Spirosoma oryzae TaxID=1469603 RepID=A0A2T0SAF6_9BACT|nr:MFS transporter [Spirosoma oryzae]PRY30392.1 ACS family hexuronate transporter-like MFS transporter [Spirosoma oryzae]